MVPQPALSNVRSEDSIRIEIFQISPSRKCVSYRSSNLHTWTQNRMYVCTYISPFHFSSHIVLLINLHMPGAKEEWVCVGYICTRQFLATSPLIQNHPKVNRKTTKIVKIMHLSISCKILCTRSVKSLTSPLNLYSYVELCMLVISSNIK